MWLLFLFHLFRFIFLRKIYTQKLLMYSFRFFFFWYCKQHWPNEWTQNEDYNCFCFARELSWDRFDFGSMYQVHPFFFWWAWVYSTKSRTKSILVFGQLENFEQYFYFFFYISYVQFIYLHTMCLACSFALFLLLFFYVWFYFLCMCAEIYGGLYVIFFSFI